MKTTTFTFRKGAFDGPLKRFEPRGFALDRASNAVWGMRFLWPLKGESMGTAHQGLVGMDPGRP